MIKFGSGLFVNMVMAYVEHHVLACRPFGLIVDFPHRDISSFLGQFHIAAVKIVFSKSSKVWTKRKRVMSAGDNWRWQKLMAVRSQ